MAPDDGRRLVTLQHQIRRTILDQSRRANVGHIGSSLSIADILAMLYGGVLRGVGSDDHDRDRFILSKGHAALALYAALDQLGVLAPGQISTYCADGSLLGVHPEHGTPGVDFSAGSLGHGLSVGAGTALAARLEASARRTFVLLSDAECNEGSTWEAAMFAGHHRLASLVAILDLNGQQALGYTADVQHPGPMVERWRSVGWDVHEVDGHDVAAMGRLIAALDTTDGPPHILVPRTVFGRGVPFMEHEIAWHYLPMDEDQYEQALNAIEAI